MGALMTDQETINALGKHSRRISRLEGLVEQLTKPNTGAAMPSVRHKDARECLLNNI